MRDAAPKDEEKGQKGQMCYIVEADDILPLGVKRYFMDRSFIPEGFAGISVRGFWSMSTGCISGKEWRFHGTITRFCAACPSTARSQKSDETGSAQRWKMMR